ncbi:MAG: hypothetical protein AB1458_00375 [Bacteroidota bacterium]|jgi:hypothetical protein
MYTGIHFFQADLTPQEYEKIRANATQRLIRYSLICIPLLGLIGYGLYYANKELAGKPDQQVLYQVIGGVGGLAEAILLWYYGSFLWNFSKDFKDKKKKIATGIIQGKRILRQGKFNESCRMLFSGNEFVISRDTYDKIEKGAKIELHLTLATDQVLFIRRVT